MHLRYLFWGVILHAILYLACKEEDDENPILVMPPKNDTISIEYIPLQSGRLSERDGTPVVYIDSTQDFFSYAHTPRFIEKNELQKIDFPEIVSLSFFCYNRNFRFLGVVKDGSALVAESKWVKCQISKDSGRINTHHLLVESPNEVGFVESFNSGQSGITINHHSFEVIPSEFDSDIEQANPGFCEERHFDNGFIILPPNYTPLGPPVPLVIFWHGTGGFNFRNRNTISYKEQLYFLAMNGYAVADCSGMTDKFQIGESEVEGKDCRLNPLALSCFCSLYHFLKENYNVRTDGVYLLGKSNGGLGVSVLSILRPFPVKCVASLAGSLSIVGSFRYSSKVNLDYWFSQFKIDPDSMLFDFSTGFWYKYETEKDKQFILQNVDKFKKYDPMIMSSDISASELAEAMFRTSYLKQDTPELWNIINKGKKNQPVPMRIWHAEDDRSVPIEISLFYQKMIENAGGECCVRVIPAGFGGHHAVDNSSLAPKVLYKTKNAGDVSIVETYAEVVDWFNGFN